MNHTNLYARADYMASLLDITSDAVIATDNRFVVIGWNKVAERMYGWTAEEALGHPINDLVQTEYPYHRPDTALNNFLRVGKWSGEVLQRKRDGTKFYVFSTMTAVRDANGALIGSLAINRDVTERKQAEQMESFFAQIFDESFNEIYIFHADTYQFIHVNRAARDNVGYSMDELRGMTFMQVRRDDETEGLAEILRALRAGETAGARLNGAYHRKDGTTYPVEMSLQFMMYGNLPIFIAIALDMSHRKQMEDALRASERLYRALVDSQIDFVCRYTPDTILTFVNEAYCRFFGRSREELIGTSFLTFGDSEQTPMVLARIEEVLRDPRPAVREIRTPGADGKVHWIQWVDHGIVDDDGNVVMIQAVGRDVTAVKKAQEQFRAMLEAAVDAILLVRQDGQIVLANQSTEKIFGYPLSALVGQNVEKLLPEALREPQRLRNDYQVHPIAKPMGHGQELYGQRADGTQFPIEVSLSPIEADGEQLVMCIISDVTERRQAQAERMEAEKLRLELDLQRQLIAMKEEFISVVSHEFRTPLTVIQSSKEILELYEERLTPERRRQHLRKIGDQVAYMRELLDQVLVIGRMKQGKMDFQPEPVNVPLLCQDLLEQARLEGTDSHRWILDISPEIDQAQLDPRLLQHIFTNLLSNAAKYSPDGGEIRFSVICDGDDLLFTVSDEGIGIPEADQKRLFETFFRAKNVGDIRGTGLGLAIVRESVSLHGGRIHFSSTPNKGTRFEVRLPFSKVTHPVG